MAQTQTQPQTQAPSTGYQPKLRIPLTEKLKSIPETFGIRMNEEPSFDVLYQDGPVEIRRYTGQIQASITIANMSFDKYREVAFRNLAAYIFGDNYQERVLEMTAPVLQHGHAEEVVKKDEWTMSFVLPVDVDVPPQPLNPEIKVEKIPTYDVAVLGYSGNNSLEKIKQHRDELQIWLKNHPAIHIKGPITIAQYDAPFVIPFLKRNEIHAHVEFGS